MNKTDFYKNERRAKSGEIDFGVWWRESSSHPTFRVSWIRDTGEVYAHNYSDESFEVLGIVATEAVLEEVLKGWAEKCGHINSLDWVRERIEEVCPICHGAGEISVMAQVYPGEPHITAEIDVRKCLCQKQTQ